jgi:hypothetical protein
MSANSDDMPTDPDAVDQWNLVDEPEETGSSPAPPVEPSGLVIEIPPRRSRKGRPSKRSAEIIARVIEGVSNGMPLGAACNAVGITYPTFNRWRLVDPEGSGPMSTKGINLALQSAEAEFQRHHIGVIVRASEKSWQASAWLLERKWPLTYGRRLLSDKRVEQHLTIEHGEAELAAFTQELERLIPDDATRRKLAVQVLRLDAPKQL